MTSPCDKRFFSNLILHCLNYTPRVPREVWYLPEIKTLRSIQYAVNIIRSDYYSWFLTLISKIPEDHWKVKRLTDQVRCLNLNDKNEEFLLSISLLVQLIHFIVMKHQCFNYIDVAASCLRNIFAKKYRVIFSETDSWNEFQHYCEIILQRKRKFFQNISALHESGTDCQTDRKDIFRFWSREKINRLRRFSKEIRRISEPNSQPIFCYYFDNLSTRWIEMFINPAIPETVHAIEKASEAPSESNDSMTNNPNCKIQTGFCLGCFLSVSYPEVKKKELKITHELMKNFNSPEKENDVSQRGSKPRAEETSRMENSISTVDIDEDPLKLLKNGNFSEVKIGFSMVDHQDSRKVERSEDSSNVPSEDLPLSSEGKIVFSKVDHQDSRKVKRSEDSNTPSEDLLLSVIEVLKSLLVFGIIALKKRFTSWLTILKDVLKSPLTKVLFYFLRVFRGILYFKMCEKVNPVNLDPASGEHALTEKDDSTESEGNQPTLNPASREDTSTLKDSSIENKETPSNLNPVSEKHGFTSAENPLEYKENPPIFDSALEKHPMKLIDDSTANVPSSKAESAMGTPHFEIPYPNRCPTFLENATPSQGKASITTSEAQEGLAKKKILSGVESFDMLPPSGDEDSVASDELVIEPQEPEIVLDTVQTCLDWTKGTRMLKRIFYSEGMKSFPNQECSFCKTKCYTKFYDCLDNYKKDFKT